MKLSKYAVKLKRLLSTAEPATNYSLSSYSQEGEDMVIRRFVNEDKPGFYVDIGAHHPERFSNTLFYYNRGWNGINVDADPDLMELFAASRPRDINITSAVGKKSASLTFHVFNERALNTLDPAVAKERAAIDGYTIVKKRKIPVKPLEEILNKQLPKGQTIDFITIDVEGKDIEVLQSNNWNKYRPRFLVVECLKTPYLDEIRDDRVVKYLAGKNYRPVAKTINSVFFADCTVYGK